MAASSTNVLETGYAVPPPDDREAYPGFWIRAAARIIDSAAINIGIIFRSGCSNTSPSGIHRFNPDSPDMPWNVLLGVAAFAATVLAVPWLYFAGFEASAMSATPGKYVTGLRVVDMDGRRLGFIHTTLRYLASYLSGFACGVGYLICAVTPQKQTLHEMLTGTLTVWASESGDG